MTDHENQFLGKQKGLAVLAFANSSSFVVAGARNAECYTAPESHWIDLN